MKLIYNVNDRPPFGKALVFAFQQLLAILAATIAVPKLVGNGMSASAALFGAGVGTLIYQLLTKFKSPVFLGSSFAFLGSMAAAFAGGVSMSAGYLGLLIGAGFAGLVYVALAILVKFAGVNWISKIMPSVVIGPTVAIIGLSLAGNAVGDMLNRNNVCPASTYVTLICALVTLAVTIIASVYGKKTVKMIPFILGICAGYLVSTVFTLIGKSTGNSSLIVIDFSQFENMVWYPEFTFLKAFSGNYFFGFSGGNFWTYLGTIAVAYIPVAFVVFAEHIADHKNLSLIIENDLLKEPGLHRTLLGDGLGSAVGAFFGGCPNTTYGESVGCVAITKNASAFSITITAFLCIIISFIAPISTFLSTIPACVMGGVCLTLYGFIACSGLKMIQKVDLNDNSNLFVVSVIIISGVGGLSLTFGKIPLTTVACSLILGILTNLLVKKGRKEQVEGEHKSDDYYDSIA